MIKLEDVLNNIKEKAQDNDGLELRYAFIEQLQNYRRIYSLSQNSFAEKIGLKQQAIARFEKGEIDPRLSFIYKILKGISKKISFDDIEYESVGKLEKVSEQTKIVTHKQIKPIYLKLDEAC